MPIREGLRPFFCLLIGAHIMPSLAAALVEQSPFLEVRPRVLAMGRAGVAWLGFLCDAVCAIWRLTNEGGHSR